MRYILFTIVLMGLLLPGMYIRAEEPAEELPEIVQWYQKHYVFATMRDSIFTFESEFEFPDGYKSPDSSDLTPYQNWVANFPLWHRYRPIGNWKGLMFLPADSISRPVHLTWSGRRFTDRAIPIRIIGEYLLYTNRENDFDIVLTRDAFLEYEDWLHSELVFDSRSKPILRPVNEPREPSDKEFYKFVARCMISTTYQSLAKNCDSIKVDDLLPGDLIIGHDEPGHKGAVYIVLKTIKNKSGTSQHVVATGCAEACDFHIPLLTDDRNRPWVDADRLTRLVEDFPHHGFFRMKITR